MLLKKVDTSKLVFGKKLPQTLPGEMLKNFIGRESEIRSVYRQLEVDKSLILQINGPVGVGKSALGLHLAHQFRRDFSILDLDYNFDPGYYCENKSPAHILAFFVMLFNYHPSECIQENLAAYNSLMKDQRSIVFLDNVSHLEQINYLRPDNNGVVIITSRQRLDLQGAISIELEPLSDNESQQLFLDIIGAEKAAESPKAVEEICKICNGYPEALVIAARTYIVKRHWQLANYRSQLLKTDAWLNWQNNQCRWSV